MVKYLRLSVHVWLIWIIEKFKVKYKFCNKLSNNASKLWFETRNNYNKTFAYSVVSTNIYTHIVENYSTYQNAQNTKINNFPYIALILSIILTVTESFCILSVLKRNILVTRMDGKKLAIETFMIDIRTTIVDSRGTTKNTYTIV